jgi:hypothetical protein
MSETKKMPRGLFYLLALVCLIPLVGALVGFILILFGIFEYKDKKVILVGAMGIASSVIIYGSLFYVLFHRGVMDVNRIAIAKDELKDLVRDIEFYKYRTGKYPDSLKQLEDKGYNVLINDPIQLPSMSSDKEDYYYYKPLKDGYYLFSNGIDGIPFTKDDILPPLEKDSLIVKSGLIRERLDK